MGRIPECSFLLQGTVCLAKLHKSIANAKYWKNAKKFEIRYKGRFQGNVQSLSDFLFFKIFKIFRFLLFSFDDMISQENSYGLSFRKYLLYIGILRIYGSWQKAKFLQVTSYESYNLWPKTWRFKVFYCKSIIIIENNYNWKVWPCRTEIVHAFCKVYD